MNLKEAFRYQNKLSSLIDTTLEFMGNTDNMLEVTERHLRKKANPEQENEKTTKITSEYPAIEKPECVIDLGMFLLSEKEKLTAAIVETKRNLAIDIDGQAINNSLRQKLAFAMRRLSGARSNESLIRNGGTGYCFNQEGNQTSFRYDIERVVTLNYDRNKTKRLMNELSEKADSVSTEIDEALLSAKVDYVPPFNVNTEFEELALEFQDKL
ncbi:MAG: hypothetical protein IKK32_04280 [Oscillospiraceae bacterium]|nr:hypothetical protein [Oscillospiraceae bacterium]